MHVFTIEDLQKALDIEDEEKDETNERWRNILRDFVNPYKTAELGYNAFETGDAKRENADDGIGEYQRTMTHDRKDLKIAEEQGILYCKIGESHKALGSDLEALAISRELGDKKVEGRAYGNAGTAYRNIGEYQKAIDCYVKNLEISEKLTTKER